MPKSLVVLVGALVALLASLLAFLLAVLLLVRFWRFEEQILEDSQLSDLIQNFPEVPGGSFLFLSVMGLAVVASALTVAGASQRRRISKPSKLDLYRQYRRAVEMAWADRELSEAEKDRLGVLKSELNLSEYQVGEIEREVMGATKEEIRPPEDKSILQYRAAVEIAWADGKLSEAEAERLGVLESRLGLSRNRADSVEHEVMGDVKEKVTEKAPATRTPYIHTPHIDGTDRYRVAVEMAWVDEKLNEAERDYLSTLENELGLSWEQAAKIEREVMDSIKEEIELDSDEPEEKIVYRVDHTAQYRAAVEMAWADERLNRDEKDRLSVLEDELSLSWDQAAYIERGVMGAAKEEIELYEEDPTSKRDLDDEAWMKLVEECVEVVDELDRHMAALDPQSQELADHVILRLGEVLERSGIDVISDDTTFDSKRHRPEKAGSRTSSGATIIETLSPGFAVGRRVLRRARVRVE